MLKLIGPPMVLAAFAVSASAQSECLATTRELSALTPRDRAAELTFPVRSDRDVLADAATCAVRPQLVGGPSRIIETFRGTFDLHESLQPLVVRFDGQGGLSDPRDDGVAWTGRGANLFVGTGVAVDAGWFHVILAPQFWYAQNRPYQVFPSLDTLRNQFASPLYAGQYSADLPSRFGAGKLAVFDAGETAAWLTYRAIDIGASTSQQRWGPGDRGTLILGSDAPGIPRAFLRTTRPVKTAIGNFSGTAFVGVLTQSRFFVPNATGRRRTMTAWNVAWTQTDTSAFIAGIAHASMRPGLRFGGGPFDQINELYAQYRDRWSGVRLYGELGRAGALPGSRQFFTVPYQGLVYVVGANRGVKMRHGMLLVSGEAANLEQPTDLRGGSPHDFYTSPDVSQGWTQRGQLLGYPTGPGSQLQSVSTDWISPRWSFGLFGERVRWNEDALLRQFLAYPNRHDMTIRGGVRGGVVWGGNQFTVEGSLGHRLNYLFQNATFIPGYRTVDVSVPALRLMVTPAINIR